MTASRSVRASARRWVAARDFPGKRRLLVDQHLLPSYRLARLVNALLVGPSDAGVDVVSVVSGVRLHVDVRSVAQRAVAYGLSDEAELDLLHALLRAGDVVVDVGANIGLYALVAARRVGPQGKVFAFEPNPVALAQLRRNVVLNDARNVVVFEAAVSDGDGRAVLRSPDPREPGLATIAGEGKPIAEVEAVALDDVSALRRVGRISLLKIDAEGAELSVLRGAERLLRSGVVDRVLIEALAGATAPQRFLAGLGWETAVVRSPGERGPIVRPCRPEESFQYANLLCSRVETRA